MKKIQFHLYRGILMGLIIGMMLHSFPVMAHRFDKVNIHIWNTETNSNFFPERDDPRVNVEWLQNRPSFGIAFSGGGTRSAAATLGELRALKQLGWIERAKYMSANSGGSWTVMPFIYLPMDINENLFLGAYVPPEKIDDKVLNPPNVENDKLSMSSAIYRTKIVTRLRSLKRGDEAYADVIGKMFLKPFGLHKRKKVFTFHDKALKSALENNSKLQADDFQFVSRQRPYPIFVGSLSVPRSNYLYGKSELYLIESTPLYTGVRNKFVAKGTLFNSDFLLGGGYVESFGYDSYEPNKDEPNKEGLWEVQLEGRIFRKNTKYRFTLSDVIGMSGAAPAITIADVGLRDFVFPKFRHWAIDRNTTLSANAKELIHGDGGDIDNLALMPLLTRKVENILVFINTATRFPEKNADCNKITDKVMVDDLFSLFTEKGTNKKNVIINDQDGMELKKLCMAFVDLKKDGEPLVYCDKYNIKDNHRLAVLGKDYHPSICWVYLDRSKKWINAIKPNGENKTSDLIAQIDNFDVFPHYKTFGESTANVIDLNRARVHALSNLTAWSVIKNKEYLEENLFGVSLD